MFKSIVLGAIMFAFGFAIHGAVNRSPAMLDHVMEGTSEGVRRFEISRLVPEGAGHPGPVINLRVYRIIVDNKEQVVGPIPNGKSKMWKIKTDDAIYHTFEQ